MVTPLSMAAVPNEFDEIPTRVDVHAAARFDWWRRVEQHIAVWELEELQLQWAAQATNYSDDFVDSPTVEVRR